jgi:hypothetical protein
MTGSRSRLLLGAAVAALLLVGVITVVARSGDDPSKVATDRTSTTTSSSTSSTSSTTTPAAATTSPTVAVTSSTIGTSTTRTSTTKPPTTSTTKKEPAPEARCAESSSGAPKPAGTGWEHLWQTKPADNDPATIRVCVDDVTPKVGQTVHLTLVGDDPDARIVQAECGWYVTWDGDHASLCRDFLTPVTAPMPTPAEEHGHIETTESHAYDQVGAKTITASVWSGEYSGVTSPYSSYAEAAIAVQVHA